MTPKKAIIIVLSSFVVMAMVFVFLYLQKQLTGPADELKINRIESNKDNQSSREKLAPVQQQIKAIETKTNQQVEQIIEQGKTAAGGIAPDAQRKLEEVVNQEIMEKTKLKTPEQLKADQQRQAELDKLEQQVNQQIKSQLQNK